jgi:hypothetical protein
MGVWMNLFGLLLMGTGAYLLLMLLFGAMFFGGIYLALRPAAKGQLNQGRRAFLGGRAANEHALFFGLQLVIQVFGSDELRARLARLVQAEDETDTAQEKRRFIKSVASLLIENQYAWEYGFWDYQTEAQTAISTFNQWRNEIEASMATEPEELGQEVDSLHRFSDQKEYLIVTLMMIIDNRDEKVTDDVGDYQFRPTYEQLAAPFRAVVEGVDKDKYWQADTFARLLGAVRALDPRAIERDGIYVYPGSEQDGLSSLDLLGDEEWKYLTDHAFRLN